MERHEYIVNWTADCYCVEFSYSIIAENLEKAKDLWNEYINTHEELQYSWNKAMKAVKYHHGGYIKWEDNGITNKADGCYDLETINTYSGSDHLRD